MIEIAPEALTLLQGILNSHIPGAEIWVFGSRAKGTARRGSDLDLAIDAGAPLQPSARIELAEALDEAPLAFNVDLVDLRTVSPEFRAHIDAHKIALPGFS